MRYCSWLGILAAIAVCSAQARAQQFWEYAGGLPEHTFSTIAIAPAGDIYASNASTYTVWHSSSGGARWERRDIGMPGVACNVLAVTPRGTLLLGSHDHGLYRSTDNGRSWVETGFRNARVNSMSIDSAGVIYADSAGSSIWRSGDDGRSWVFYGASAGITSLAISPAGTLWVGTSAQGIAQIAFGAHGEVYRVFGYSPYFEYSSDNGTTWTKIGPPAFNRSQACVIGCVASDTNGRLYVGLRYNRQVGQGGGVWYTTDNGITWTEKMVGMQNVGAFKTSIQTLVIDRKNLVYAGCNGGGLYAAAAGGDWIKLDNTLPVDIYDHFSYPPAAAVSSVAAVSSRIVYAAVDGSGVFRTDDSGTTWRTVNRGLPDQTAWKLLAGKDGAVFAVFHENGIWRLRPQDSTWTKTVPPSPSLRHMLLERHSNGTLYAASASDGLYASTDNGTTWRFLSDAPRTKSFIALTVNSRGHLYGCSGSDTGQVSSRVFRSEDSGITWIDMGSPVYDIGSIAATSRGDIYCVSRGMGLPPWYNVTARTTNGGTFWEWLDTPFLLGSYAYGSAISVDARDIIYLGSRNGIAYSTDAGSSWKFETNEPEEVTSISVAPDGMVYVSCLQGVMRSRRFASALRATPRVLNTTLRADSVTGDYVGNPLTVWCSATNAGARALDSVRAEFQVAASDARVLSAPSQLLAAHLDTSQTSAEQAWTVQILPRSTKATVRLSFLVTSKQYPDQTVTLDLVVPARPKPSFIGTLRVEPEYRIRFDSALNRYRDPVTADGKSARFTVTARLRNRGAGPSFVPTVTLSLPHGVELDSGETAKKTLAPAPLAVGDSLDCVWRCVTSGYTHDSLAWVAAQARDDSVGTVAIFGTDLFIEANRRLRHGTLACALSTDPPDTLHYDAAKKDYEGWPSAMGAYSVFHVVEHIRNAGGVTVTGVFSAGNSMSPFIVPDSGAYPWTPTMTPGEVRSMVWEVRALPDTVWRTAEFCSTFIAENADTVKCCTRLVIEPFPKPGTTGLVSTSSDGFALEQNFPNPIVLSAAGSAQGVIRYAIPVASSVHLTLHDALGRQVQQLCSGIQDAGWHTASFDPMQLAPGVYHYRLVAGTRMLQRSMTIVR